jgi:hypothetical protein
VEELTKKAMQDTTEKITELQTLLISMIGNIETLANNDTKLSASLNQVTEVFGDLKEFMENL